MMAFLVKPHRELPRWILSAGLVVMAHGGVAAAITIVLLEPSRDEARARFVILSATTRDAGRCAITQARCAG